MCKKVTTSDAGCQDEEAPGAIEEPISSAMPPQIPATSSRTAVEKEGEGIRGSRCSEHGHKDREERGNNTSHGSEAEWDFFSNDTDEHSDGSGDDEFSVTSSSGSRSDMDYGEHESRIEDPCSATNSQGETPREVVEVEEGKGKEGQEGQAHRKMVNHTVNTEEVDLPGIRIRVGDGEVTLTTTTTTVTAVTTTRVAPGT
ncbi:hypothetical protein K435DRAFT_190024 [Dendrothele bispora CBS 962.96]|uniref:Uncharacterized protein n=1 Tax=Dendrothele bispora (strain CBS 962.96) TaxID=1314807 RepID=A0A4S8KLN7_DENBC|nr:hypothetical protein K435DRAFT_190024 [Dendrothele bispora CBS 962.96]